MSRDSDVDLGSRPIAPAGLADLIERFLADAPKPDGTPLSSYDLRALAWAHPMIADPDWHASDPVLDPEARALFLQRVVVGPQPRSHKDTQEWMQERGLRDRPRPDDPEEICFDEYLLPETWRRWTASKEPITDDVLTEDQIQALVFPDAPSPIPGRTWTLVHVFADQSSEPRTSEPSLLPVGVWLSVPGKRARRISGFRPRTRRVKLRLCTETGALAAHYAEFGTHVWQPFQDEQRTQEGLRNRLRRKLESMGHDLRTAKRVGLKLIPNPTWAEAEVEVEATVYIEYDEGSYTNRGQPVHLIYSGRNWRVAILPRGAPSFPGGSDVVLTASTVREVARDYGIETGCLDIARWDFARKARGWIAASTDAERAADAACEADARAVLASWETR